MRIVRLETENIKRIRALTVEPGEAGLVVIAGRNGQGKSSALDSIAYALGGKDLVPPEPIRRGESEGKITVDLGEFVVTRVFKREMGICTCGAEHEGGNVHATDCPSQNWGPTKSTLTVKGKDIIPGVAPKYPSPQALLDTMVGKLTFDPLEFMGMAPSQQAETLRKIAGLDFAVVNAKRAALFAARTEANREAKAARAHADAMPKWPDAGDCEIDPSEVADQLNAARAAMEVAEARDRAASNLNRKVQDHEAAVKTLEHDISRMQRELEEKARALTIAQEQMKAVRQDAKAAEQAASEARAAVPNTEAVQAKVIEIESTNRKVRANLAAIEAGHKADALENRVIDLTVAIEDIDDQKKVDLKNAKFPVDGLGLGDGNSPTFNGVPLEQASQAEQLEVSIAIGASLNPSLRVLLVRQGSLLDSEGLRDLAAVAEERKMQVWVERVSDGEGPATVTIEDGEAKS